MAKDKSKKAAGAEDTVEDVKPAKVKKDKSEKVGKPASGDDYGLGAPAAGDLFNNRENKDELLLVTPIELVEGMVTSASKEPTDAIKANIVVLNKKDPSKSREYSDSLIFGRVLVGQLKPAVVSRTRVVGTLIEDLASKKQGQNAPWRLTAPSDPDVNVAKAYLDTLNPLR